MQGWEPPTCVNVYRTEIPREFFLPLDVYILEVLVSEYNNTALCD